MLSNNFEQLLIEYHPSLNSCKTHRYWSHTYKLNCCSKMSRVKSLECCYIFLIFQAKWKESISWNSSVSSYSFRHKIKSVKVIIDKHFRDACHIDVLTVHLRSCCCFLQSVCLLGMCCLFCRVDSIMLVEEGFNMVSVDASDKMLKYALKSRWERRKEPAFDKWGMACLI